MERLFSLLPMLLKFKNPFSKSLIPLWEIGSDKVNFIPGRISGEYKGANMSFNKAKTTPKEIIMPTAEGGLGFKQDAKMELYRVVTTSLLAKDDFYESTDKRVSRIRSLISTIKTSTNGPEFLAGLAVYARNEMFLRSSPTMLIAEMFAQSVVTSRAASKYVWLRGDEHVEGLAYLKNVGLKRPKQYLKAVGDFVNTFSEYTADKYKLEGKTFTQRDAIRLAHPEPKDDKQSALFKYITRGWDSLSEAERSLLPLIAKKKSGTALTWEQQLSTKGASKESWETIIPKMGYMALLRNLRNFIEQNVSLELINKVAKKLSDPQEVRNSKQLPWRFINAYLALDVLSKSNNSQSINILGKAIRVAMDLSIQNVPALDGNTLVLVDTSGSMTNELPSKPKDSRFVPKNPMPVLKMMDIGIILGCIVMGQNSGELWEFASTSSRVNFRPGTDVIERVSEARAHSGRNGHGTEIAAALDNATRGRHKYFNRVIILTDMQGADSLSYKIAEIRKSNPRFEAYVIDLAGYEVSCIPKGSGNHQLSGVSPNLFKWISQNEAGENIIGKLVSIGKTVVQGTYSNNADDEDNEDID